MKPEQKFAIVGPTASPEYHSQEYTEDARTPLELLEVRQNFAKNLDKFSKTECNKYVQTTWTEQPFDNRYNIGDISFMKDCREDNVYSIYRNIHQKIRKGCTIIKSFDTNFKITDLTIGRRGLKKFYALSECQLYYSEGKISYKQLVNKYGKDEANIDSVTLDKIYRAFKEIYPEDDRNYNKITVFESKKLEGVASFISYQEFQEEKEQESKDQWIISSKNVTICCRAKEDIDQYDDKRYFLAKLIAKFWFDFLDTKSPAILKEIKDFQKQHTLVGDYCGDKNLQTIVDYPYKDIIFYAIVNKYSLYTCIPMDISIKKFDEYGLTSVQYKTYKNLKTNFDVTQQIRKIYDTIKKSSVKDQDEGAVLSFMSSDKNGDNKKMISMCIVKNQEYVFYKKIKERALLFVEHQWELQKTIKKFSKEFQAMVNVKMLPNSLNYYEKFIEMLLNAVDLLTNKIVANNNKKVVWKIVDQKFYQLIRLAVVAINLDYERVEVKELENMCETNSNFKEIDIEVGFLETEQQKFEKIDGESKNQGSKQAENDITNPQKDYKEIVIVAPIGLQSDKNLYDLSAKHNLELSFKKRKQKSKLKTNYLTILYDVPKQKKKYIESNNCYYYFINVQSENMMNYCQNVITSLKGDVKLQVDPKNLKFISYQSIDHNNNKKNNDEKVTEIQEIQRENTYLQKYKQTVMKAYKELYKIDKNKAKQISLDSKSKAIESNDEILEKIGKLLSGSFNKSEDCKDCELALDNDQGGQKEGSGLYEISPDEYCNDGNDDFNKVERTVGTSVVFVLFCGLPGIGKSYFCDFIHENLSNNGVNIQIIKGDAIWTKIIEKSDGGADNSDSELLNEQSQKFDNKLKTYERKLRKEVKSCCENIKLGRNQIQIDKNNLNEKLTKDLKYFYKKCFIIQVNQTKIVLLKPNTYNFSLHQKQKKTTKEKNSYAPSISLIQNCMYRILKKELHNEDSNANNFEAKIYSIVNYLTYFKKSENYNQFLKNENKLHLYDNIVDICFHNEGFDGLIPQKIEHRLMDCLLTVKKPFTLESNEKFKEFLNEFQLFMDSKKFESSNSIVDEFIVHGVGVDKTDDHQKQIQQTKDIFGFEYSQEWANTIQSLYSFF